MDRFPAHCDRCKSARLKEVRIIRKEVGSRGYKDLVLNRCSECLYEQENLVLRARRIPKGIII